MTLQQTQDRVKQELFGDVDYKLTQEQLIKKVGEAFNDISRLTTPRKWITTSDDKYIIKYFNNEPIRHWYLPADMGSILDIDVDLLNAVVYFIALDLSADQTNQARLNKSYIDTIRNYNWNYYSAVDLGIANGEY